MSQPYIGQLLLVGFNFAPQAWANCNGELQSISQNPTLFTLIGTTYGGDGQSTFGLPDLRGRIPIHQGTLAGGGIYAIGQQGGVESVPVTLNQFPAHTHALQGSSTAASSNIPAGDVLGGVSAYTTAAPNVTLNNATIGNSGGGNQAHNNLQPFLVLNWVIALFGIYPSRN